MSIYIEILINKSSKRKIPTSDEKEKVKEQKKKGQYVEKGLNCLPC